VIAGGLAAPTSSCASGDRTEYFVYVEDRSLVRGCRQVAEVDATDVRRERAMEKVTAQAHLAGATHIWLQMTGTISCGLGMTCATVRAQAFQCPEI